MREATVKEMGKGCQGGTSKCPCAVGGGVWCPSSHFPFSYRVFHRFVLRELLLIHLVLLSITSHHLHPTVSWGRGSPAQ